MDISSLKKIISEADIANEKSFNLSFIEKRKNGYTAYIPVLEKSLRESLKNLYLTSLEKNIFDYEQQKYNELGREDDVLDVSDLKVGNIENIIEEIYKQEHRCLDLTKMNLDKINYYVVKVFVNDQTIYLFRRFNKQKKLRKGIKGKFAGNSFVKIDNEIIGIDDEIDIIVFNDEALIINRYALQTIFDLSDYFLGKTDQAMRVIEGYGKINNFELFEKDCKNDGTAIKRLTKIVNTPELITGFFDNIVQLPKVIKDLSLVISMDPEGKVNYEGSRDERTQILSCIADKYYITLLQGKVGEDKLK
ncbi:Kiwa anti-phage protein KwaB-like domain-containing protein [Enterococcus mundtii]|uniref:Kiwa anti-phage protein KwaB-like domain-containing protein n=1 Tax=Enterococcus mundtii TaxID=53346 RepID=UPI0010BE3FA2|nr:Kiwa anti-phage protein KwaB-like domain-containing protein [Enterococcus mundtii]QCJ56156.1 DUF4868 domain-containing protein [Enterococcus mundtii]